MELLGDEEVQAAVADLQWEREGNELVKVVSRRDHPDVDHYVQQVQERADEANHHPDVEVTEDALTLRLTTHDAGGITQRDLDMAAAIDLLDLGH